MAIQHHPLSNAALGEFLKCEHAEDKSGALITYDSIFYYWLGEVRLDKNWKYHTELYKIEAAQTEGTHYRNRHDPHNEQKPFIVLDSLNQLLDKDEQTIESTDHVLFQAALSYDISVLPRQEPNVQVQLDKQSIDGMDDVADYREWCLHQDSLHSSEADEASTEQKDR